MQLQEIVHPTFRNVALSGVQPNVLTAFNSSRATYINAICRCINGRFEDLKNKYFRAVGLLDTQLWPSDKNDLTTFGIADVSLAIDHFKPLLLHNNVSLDGIMADWTSFKLYWVDNLRTTVQRDIVWSLLLSHYNNRFPNLFNLVNILLLFPISNAKVERGFSTMRRIKTDWRSNLGEDTLDHLMRLSIDGHPLEQFAPRPAVKKFFSTPRRTNVQPYHKKQWSHPDVFTYTNSIYS